MSGTSESHDDDLPFLPPAPPTPPPPPPRLPTAPSAPTAHGRTPPPAPPTGGGDATDGEPAFDARAMVAAQRRAVPSPSYGTLPEGTDESRAAAQGLRDRANRKRRRNRRIGWLVALVFLVGIAVAGFLAYRSYQDDQDRRAEELVTDVADGADDAGSAGPLGEQNEVLDALDALDDPARPSAGGALGAIDAAQEAVDDLAATSRPEITTPADPPTTTPTTTPTTPTTTPTTVSAPPVIELGDVRPDVVVLAGTRLADVDGHEVYVITAEAFADADRLRYVAFLDLLSAQPQLPTDDPALDLLPRVEPGELAIAVRRDGDRLLRAVVVGLEPELRVDYAP